MYNFFFNPTPKQFLYLIITYLVIVTLTSYFLAGGLIAFMGAVMSVGLVAYVYTLTKNTKIRDNKFVYFLLPMGVIYSFVFHSGILFRENLIEQKSQLQQVTGIIPQTHTYKSYGSGKSRRSYYYLTIGDKNLHCAEDDYDDCERIYAYHGHTTTVYYQADSGVGNLVYEIIVDNQAVYPFEHQLKTLKYQRQKQNLQWFFAFVLYGIPSLYFYVLSRGVIEQLDIMTDEEYQEMTVQQQRENYHFSDTGVMGYVVMIMAVLLLCVALILFIVGFANGGLSVKIWGGILLFISVAILYKVSKQSSINRQKRLGIYHESMIDDEPKERSLLFKIFRIIVLMIIIPTGLLFLIVTVKLLFKGELVTAIFGIIMLTMIGYVIRKIW